VLSNVGFGLKRPLYHFLVVSCSIVGMVVLVVMRRMSSWVVSLVMFFVFGSLFVDHLWLVFG